MQIFPNPGSGRFTLSHVKGADLSIFTITGGLLLFEKGLENEKQVDLSTFDKGVYLVRIEKEGGCRNFKVVIE